MIRKRRDISVGFNTFKRSKTRSRRRGDETAFSSAPTASWVNLMNQIFPPVWPLMGRQETMVHYSPPDRRVTAPLGIHNTIDNNEGMKEERENGVPPSRPKDELIEVPFSLLRSPLASNPLRSFAGFSLGPSWFPGAPMSFCSPLLLRLAFCSVHTGPHKHPGRAS